MADAALARCRDLGASHADFRCDCLRESNLQLRDAMVSGSSDHSDLGASARVLVDGGFGFASTVDLTQVGAQRVAEQAVALARAARPLAEAAVELADEPVYDDVEWISSYEVNPFDVPTSDKIGLLADWCDCLLAQQVVSHVYAKVRCVQENKFYADLAGTTTTQQRVRIHPMVIAVSISDDSQPEMMRSLGPPSGRGWEYMTGSGWDWRSEFAQLPEFLAEKHRAPSVDPGAYDLVIDPTNLWLTIHESVGHATEMDRMLGHEAAYAGTSFVNVDDLDQLQFGAADMRVTGDRTVKHGLATIGYDDEGVAAQSWDIIRDGRLVGLQLDRRMGQSPRFGRSNGCAYAQGSGSIALQRMPNVSLQPAAGGPSTEQLISRVERGIYVVGDNSWSIDMQRRNFQFTGQRFYAIRNGRLVGQLCDVAYQGATTEFWNSMQAVGGPETYQLRGADRCGKAQPIQIAAASHGSPSALFRGVRVLNTNQECINQ